MAAEFRRQFQAINDPELRDQIVQYVLDYADVTDEEARSADRHVELVDRAGFGVAGSVTAAGIGMTVGAVVTAKGIMAGAAVLGPVGALAGGLIGLVVAGFGRHSLKKRADQSRLVGQKLRRLVGTR